MLKTEIKVFDNLLNLMRRTGLELFASFTLAFVLIIVEYIRPIIQIVTRSDEGSQLLEQTSTEFIHEKLSRLSDLPHTDTIATVAAWVIIAVIIYASYIVISNVIIDVHNEVSVNTQAGRQYLRRHILAKLSVLIAFWVFVGISFGILFGQWITITGLFINNNMSLHTLHYGILGIVGLGWNIYFLWIAGELVYTYEKTL